MRFLITGAGSGLGKELAIQLGSEHEVIGLTHHKSLTKFNSMVCDVTKQEDVDRITTAIDEVDGIIHCAGILQIGLLRDSTVNDLRELFEVNVFAIHRINLAFLPSLVNNKGKIVIIGSDAGLIAETGLAGYSMTKFALEAYYTCIREELSSLGIEVVMINPGNFDSQLVTKSRVLRSGNKYTERAKTEFKGEKQATSYVAMKICEIIKTTEHRKLVTIREETRELIQQKMSDLVDINRSALKPLSDEELKEFLEFSIHL